MATAQGFAPSYYFAQNTAGLGIWVATGTVNGVIQNGQFVVVPANATSYVFLLENSNLIVGAALPPSGVFPIAVVVSGQVITSGNLETNTPWSGAQMPINAATLSNVEFSNGIISITDIRPPDPFTF